MPWEPERKALALKSSTLLLRRKCEETNVYVSGSNNTEVILNPEDLRVVPKMYATYALLEEKVQQLKRSQPCWRKG